MKTCYIVIPAWNEEESIGKVIKKVPRYFDPEVQIVVLVVNDGSSDQTVQRATEAGADEIVSFPTNQGLGAAVRKGLKTAYERGADLAVMIDADDEYPAEEIPQVVAPILAGDVDYVMGSRFKGKIQGMKWHRRLANMAFTSLQMVLLRKWIWDGQSGFRAFNREVLRDLEIVHDYNYAQVMTLNIIRQGYQMVEVPIHYKVRETGQSFIRGVVYLKKVFPAIWKEMTARRTKKKR
ncbi:glycosyltransferase family 2 protein [Hazenella coriacea]|uniref:Glycosyltransferase involved in cell wall biosynthesis n=1 Tax=Hazenella coriacea TaxID=1179467 RepID=A0A4R3L4P8_9BACL|nr:glycosyltransferase family 2 protein [Hazenella coriacea]TCS94312.1 glycosyltransferase involved in cell wall biosynthesis [Hazenella coriacea]